MDAFNALLDTLSWQEFLNRQKHAISKISDGGKIGILLKSGTGGGGENPLLVWTVREGKVSVHHEPFRGFRECGAHLLFVADPPALERVYRELEKDAMAELKKQIRHGGVVFFVLKNRDELLDLGFEDFIESVGIPWVGTCH
ncbi:MAG: hypothetical protein ACOY30_11260 [Bacillota bacterium]